MTIRQLSAFVENQTGRLFELTDALSAAGVDIRALSLADTSDFGVLRLIVSDVEAGKRALTTAGFGVSITNVIGVEMKNEIGGLSGVLKVLLDNDISVEYMYAFISPGKTVANAILRVADNAAAERVLAAHNLTLLEEAY